MRDANIVGTSIKASVPAERPLKVSIRVPAAFLPPPPPRSIPVPVEEPPGLLLTWVELVGKTFPSLCPKKVPPEEANRVD